MALCEGCVYLVQPEPEVEGPQTVAELEMQMAQVEVLMKRLETHRSGLRRRINSLAPIARLPSEILIEIFSFACCHTSSTTPLFLGSICAGWRRLAWSTPLLWCHITLQVAPTLKRVKLRLLSEWLQRANTTPLHIKLYTLEEDDATFYSIRAIMEVLAPRSMYWGTIECLLPPQCHDLLSTHQFPILTNVTFRPPKGSISTFNQPPDMFQSTPLLADLDLSGYDFSSMELPWAQLRKFRTQFLTVTECLKVLQQSPHLVQCFLENVYCPDNLNFFATPSSRHTQIPQLVHADLETLEVTLIKASAISLLDMISLPSLKELGLHYIGTENVSLLPVISLVSRSSASCNLTKLSISRCIFGEEDLVRCLEALPMLEDLQVGVREAMHPTFGNTVIFGSMNMARREGLSPSFVRRLYPAGTEAASDGSCHYLVPVLRKFSYEGLMLCPMSMILDMLEWRWKQSKLVGMARLEFASISLRRSREMAEQDSKRLADLIAQGMHVSIVQG